MRMSALGVLAGAALGLGAAAVYAALGAREARRAGKNGRWASAALSIFWLGLGIHVGVDSIWGLAASSARLAPETSAVVLHLKIASGGIAFAGLVHHLLYLYAGRGFALPVVAFHVLAMALVEYNYASRVVVGHEMSAFAARHAFLFPATGLEDLAYVLLFSPAIAATLAYARLARTTDDPLRRTRMRFQATALLGFFVGLLAGFVIDVPWWEPVERALALSTGVAAFASGVGAPVETARQGPQAS
jgi:hypothetical protein